MRSKGVKFSTSHEGVVQLAQTGPVLVVGPGAIGLAIAARLADAGHEVVLAARDAAVAKRLASGIAVQDPLGATTAARVPVVWQPAQTTGARMLVLATKCSDAEAALRAWLPSAGEDAPVLALQNGVLGDVLRPVAGDRYVECTVSFPATLAGPGRSIQTGPGGFHLGPWPTVHPRDDPQAFRAAGELLANAGPVQASPNMRGVKWTKLAINSCITGLGALTGAELGDLLADARARQVFLRIAEEAYAAGRADGVRFEAVSGFRPGLFGRHLPGRAALLSMLGRKYRRHRSSSLQSLERGRRTEVDWLNGHVVATARRHGLEAPANVAVVDLVHDIESGRAQPSLAHLGSIPV